MFKILVSDKLASEGLEILKSRKEFQVDVKTGLKPEELKGIIGEYDAIVIRSGTKLTADVLAAAGKLKAVARAGAGVDNVDVPAASSHGVIVMNTPGGNTVSTAEHTFAMLLAMARTIPQAQASLKSGQWDRKSFMGTELAGKTLGVIGLGRVGFEVAKRARAFEMSVLGFDPYFPRDDAGRFGIEVVAELEPLLRKSDFITVHTPLNDQTRGLIGSKAFEVMRSGVRIVNCARGGIVDEKALAEAIKSGKVAGAALDVYEQEPPTDRTLIDLPQVVCTPHLAASTEEAQVTVAIAAAEQLVDALINNEVRFAVNLPSVPASEMEHAKPYLTLADRMGAIVASLLGGKPRSVRLTFAGEAATLPVEMIAASFAAGLTRLMLDEPVNLVSAPIVLKQLGIELEEMKSPVSENFSSLLEASVTADGDRTSIAGTVFGAGTMRVMAIDGYPVETMPFGPLMILQNQDRPGLIGDIGSVLGEAGVNIARMTFGRKSRLGEAITVFNLDVAPGPEVLDRIGKIHGIRSVRTVNLPV